MKKLIIIVLFLITVNTFSQNSISFFGGLNYSPPTSGFFNKFYGEASLGLHFGAGYEIPINDKLTFNPKLMYSQQGIEKTEDQGEYTISRTDTHLDFINIPLNIKYGNKTYVLAGPQIGILINDKINGNYYSEIKSSFDYGINLGIGRNITDRLFLELNVFKGFATFQEFPAIAFWDEDTKIQNFYAQLSIGFSINKIMKKSDVPQDKSNLESANFKELCYAVDENGEYTTAHTTGWDPKTIALNNAIAEINERIEDAKSRVLKNQTSPIEYYMELHKMDLTILASYVGIWKWRVKRHFKPKVFQKLSNKTLQKYADVFEISIDQLKNITHAN